MTREENFHSTFALQLATYAVWKFSPASAPKALPLSSFPSFSIELGPTTYISFDFTGKAATGEQAFTLSVYFTKPENEFDLTRGFRSDGIALVEQFINTPVYIPPTMLPGDTYCIDRTKLVSVDGWRFVASDSRFVLHVNAKYLFSMF